LWRAHVGPVTDVVGRPVYQWVADDLRQKIAAGELAVGSAIPSTAQLTRAYQVSYTVVRAAVAELRGAGLVFGQPGKGVYVLATPDAVAERASSIDELPGKLPSCASCAAPSRAARGT